MLAAGAVLLGAVVADARLAALDAGVLKGAEGQHWEGAATLLEPVRQHGRHASARVWLNELGEAAVLRLRARASSGSSSTVDTRHPWPPVGAVMAVSGRIAPLGRYDAYQGRRGAHAALEVDRWRATGASVSYTHLTLPTTPYV